MASSDYIVNGTPFDLYKEQEGYSTNFSSALRVDCTYRTGPANINRVIHLTAEQSAQDPELPDELHGKECIFFRDIKYQSDYILNIIYEIKPVFGRRWISQCINQKHDWVDHALLSNIDSYAWINSTCNKTYISKEFVDLSVFSDSPFNASVSSEIDLINKSARIHISGSFSALNQSHRTPAGEYRVINLAKLRQVLKLSYIKFNYVDTSVIILGNTDALVNHQNKYFGLVGLKCYTELSKDSIYFGRIYNNQGASGAWSLSEQIYEPGLIYEIDIRHADIDKSYACQ